MRAQVLVFVLSCCLVAACAPSFPHPMTAQDLARIDSGAALVAYLAAPDANPAVCDLRSPGPHLTRIDDDVATSLVEGLAKGRVPAGLWRGCADAIFDGAPAASGAALVDAVAHAYRGLILDRGYEGSPALQARLAALQALYIERPNGIVGDAGALAAAFAPVRRAFFNRPLGPAAARDAAALLAVLDLEQGRYGGRPVDARLLDELAARGDQPLLRRFVDRLPAGALRDEARRRVVRLAIAASPYPEVRTQAGEIEARVLTQGMNRLSLLERPAQGAKLTLGVARVLVRQDVAHQRSTILRDGGPAGPALLPGLSLRGALWVEVGLSRPVTLCQPPRALDPSPCVARDDVAIDSLLAYRDRGDGFHLVEEIGERDAAALAHAGRDLALPISVGGRHVATVAWPLYFQRPDALVLDSPTGKGPDLKVTVDHTDTARFTFVVTGNGARYDAVVEAADLRAFRIVSRGARGLAGSDGMNGSDGMSGLDGASASCPSSGGGDGTPGSDGGNGGNGGDGGNGSDGGDIQVEFSCTGDGCSAADLALLRGVVVSEGGPGGAGGQGGRGGRGGRGGAGGLGTSCVDVATGMASSLFGGQPGLNGSDGTAGFNGSNGAPGKPGQVRFTAAGL